jgi:hypothetical protein
MIISQKFKLRMFGISLDGPAQVFCKNQGIVKNVSIPESLLSKKHNTTIYHAACEAATTVIPHVVKEDT